MNEHYGRLTFGQMERIMVTEKIRSWKNRKLLKSESTKKKKKAEINLIRPQQMKIIDFDFCSFVFEIKNPVTDGKVVNADLIASISLSLSLSLFGSLSVINYF